MLDYAVKSAGDLRVARAAGVESEMELVFATLHQLCGPMLDRVGCLLGPQRDALRTAFGLLAGPPPDQVLVGLAVLNLLSEAADERPLVCVIDDAQWLDRESALVLAFAARRLVAESVLVIFAARQPGAELTGLPEMTVEGLQEGDARELLGSVVRWPLDDRVRDQIVAETRGNPLALLELPRGRSPWELAGGFGLPETRSLPGRIEESFLRRVEALPEETRLLLVIAAAEPVGDPALVRSAARLLGIPAQAAMPAAQAVLLDFDDRVRFRHPLVRSAVYRSASFSDRQRVHAALAEVTDPQVDPDRRAWHRAQATHGTDEDAAAELERSAGRAQARGGLAAAAAFLERSAELTLDPARRAQRALTAAQAKYRAGAPDAALGLLAAAEAGSLDKVGRARVDQVRAQIAYSQDRGRDAPRLLLRAARRLESLDAGLARETYLDALWAAQFAGRLACGGELLEVARAALAAPPAQSSRAPDLLLDGLATAFVAGYAAGVPMLKQAVNTFRRAKMSREEELRWLWLAGIVALDLWDDESFEILTDRHIQLGRGTGALSVLPIALSGRITAHTLAGELIAAAQLVEEVRTITEAIGTRFPPYGPLTVAAWQGREAEVTKLIETTLREVTARGEGQGVATAHHARAVLCNGQGRYAEAFVAATATQFPEAEGLTIANLALPELIEAAARTGQAEQGTSALQRLSAMTRASGSDWALGIEARSRALLGEGQAAEPHYLEAIERLGRTRVRAELARTHLLYGEWLRRENRRVDAREQLRTAHEMLTEMGVDGFAHRARHELMATGETVRKRTVETVGELTAQEFQIARLAGAGHTNPEIGAQLFISVRTVEWHLRKVFIKLGISSRRQLDGAIHRAGRPALPA